MAGNENARAGHETYWDKYAIPYTPIGRVATILDLFIKTKRHRGVILMISDAGVGKTQMIHQVARANDARVVDLRTANFPLMSAGVPQRAEDGFFKVAVPDFMPRPGEKAILFFDEINQGQAHAIAMFFSLIEDRVLFNYTLPDDVIIVAAMNPATAQYMVTKLESNRAVNRRVKKFYVHTTFGDWEKHAKTPEFHHTDGLQKCCHPWVLKYLNTSRGSLYDHTVAEKNQQFPCPATWQTISLDLYQLEAEKIPLDGEVSEMLVASSIGNIHAKGLIQYIHDNEVRISPEEILEKYKPKCKLRTRVQELVKEAGGGIPDLCDNVAQYLFDHHPNPDLVSSGLALFWSDLPEELAQGFYTQMGAAAQSGDEANRKENIQYMMKLTKALQNEEPYADVNARLHMAHDNFERSLKGGKTVRDPMTGNG